MSTFKPENLTFESKKLAIVWDKANHIFQPFGMFKSYFDAKNKIIEMGLNTAEYYTIYMGVIYRF